MAYSISWQMVVFFLDYTYIIRICQHFTTYVSRCELMVMERVLFQIHRSECIVIQMGKLLSMYAKTVTVEIFQLLSSWRMILKIFVSL